MELTRSARRDKINELYEKAEKIEPFAEKDGQLYVDFESASVLNSINAFEGNHGTGIQTRNKDGSIASTGKMIHAINPDYFFLNRYLKKGKKLYVVSGFEPTAYRCIREQSSGHTFQKLIPVYVISRNDDGQLVCERRTNVEEKEFVENYTETLSNALMAEILPLITSYGTETTAVEKMPI